MFVLPSHIPYLFRYLSYRIFCVGGGGANFAREPKGRSQQRGAQGGRVRDGAFLVACSTRSRPLMKRKI